jgi:hypothetical protein
MTPTHEATLAVAHDSLEMLRTAVSGLPDEAMGWTPFPNGNPLAVLVMHSLTATRFWLACGSGHIGSLTRYRTEDRAPAFRASGFSAVELAATIDAFKAEVVELLREGTPGDLAAYAEFPEDPAFNGSGVGCLIRAVAHLREHVGHAQAIHDLWLAAPAPPVRR